MAEAKSTAVAKRRGPYNYLVCRIEGGHLVPLTANGEDASPEWPPHWVKAASPAKARGHVFAKLTTMQAPDKRDDYTIDLVAIRDEDIGFQSMAWNVTREVAK